MDFDQVSIEALVRCSDVAVLLVNENLEIAWASPAALRLFGAGHGPLPDLVDPDEASAVAAYLDRVADAGGAAVRLTCSVPVEGSAPRRVDMVGRDLRSVRGLGHLVVVAHDVTGWAEREAELHMRATTDQLTGLANRSTLTDHLARTIRSTSDADLGPAVLLFDLDRFKSVNDSLGHAGGDQILAETGRRLAAGIGGIGTAYRVGGDEFVVILDRATDAGALEVADALLASVSEPVTIEQGRTVSISASVGVAIPGRDLQHASALLSAADAAMYRAKAAGRSRVQKYRQEDRDWALARKRSVEDLTERLAELNREKEALVEAISVDYRTGLANTAAFDADHERLHARMGRSGDPYSVLLVDVDFFHGFNYRYHYLEGNRVLKQLSAVLTANVRDGDRVFRWGGEEFAVLLPDTRLVPAVAVAERLRAAVQAMGIEHSGNPFGVVTVTVGVVEATADHIGPDDVFEAVSALLVAGKDAGRNRVVTPKEQTDS